VYSAFIISTPMMEVAGASDSSVNFCQDTWHYSPDDSRLQIRRYTVKWRGSEERVSGIP
jgi:hypothetical protein